MNLNKYILEQVKDGGINEETAAHILKEIQRNQGLNRTDIAIIGIAGKFPGAENLERFWENLTNGVVSIGKFPIQRRQDVDPLLRQALKLPQTEDLEVRYSNGGYLDQIDKFDGSFFRLSTRESRTMDPLQRLFLEAAYQAIEDAGYGGRKIYGSKTGVFVGRDYTVESTYKYLITEPDPLKITGSWTGILASRISYIFNLEGPSMVIDTSCSSGLVAVHQACRALKNKECELAIAGGIQLAFRPLKSKDMEMIVSPDDTVRTFDRNANGTVWGEGVGAVLLKPFAQAVADRDHLYAVIKGSGINNDGASNGITAPNPEAQSEIISRVWKEAGINPETISFIEAHGTGTNLGDPVEIKGLTNAFRKFTTRKQFCGIGAVKTNIGHTVAASGMASLLKVLLAIEHQQIPPTVNFREPNPFINFKDSPLYVNDKLRFWENEGFPRRAGINAFGFTGTNCHLVLEEAPNSQEKAGQVDAGPTILTFSAASKGVLKQLVTGYQEFFNQNHGLELADICYTANTGRGHYQYRLAFLLGNWDDLREKIAGVRNEEFHKINEPGIYYGEHKIVPENKEKKEQWDISEGAKRKITEKARDLLKQLPVVAQDQWRILDDLCRLYIQGADVDWEELYRGQSRRRVKLPVYPLERVRHWVDLKTSGGNGATDIVYYEIGWIPRNFESQGLDYQNGRVLILTDETGFGNQLVLKLKEKEIVTVAVSIGKEFRKIADDQFLISESYADFQRLLNDPVNRHLSGVFHLASIFNDEEITDYEELEKRQRQGLYSLFHLTKALVNSQISGVVDFVVITNNAHEVTKNEVFLNPLGAAAFGMGKVIGQEYLQLKCRCLDIDSRTTPEEILKVLETRGLTPLVAFRDGRCYVEELREINRANLPQTGLSLKEDGVYLITGGTGGLGLEIGKYLAGKGKIKLSLLSRSPLPERKDWERILTEAADSLIGQKIMAIKEMETRGAEVHHYYADVSDCKAMEKAVLDLKNKFGRLNGIIHCAGIAGDGYLIRKDDKVFKQVLDAKITGVWLLDRLTKAEPLDFFVLFSSVAALAGGPGQGDYSAANAYLDATSAFRNKQGKRTVAINWPPWREVGMAVNYGFTDRKSFFKSLTTTLALNVFDQIISSAMTRVIPASLNYEALASYSRQLPISLAEPIQTELERYRLQFSTGGDLSKASWNSTEVQLRGKSIYGVIESKLAQIMAGILERQEIDVYDSFYDMGGDSLLAGLLIKEVETLYPGLITIADIYAYPSVHALAEHLKGKIDQKSGSRPSTVKSSPSLLREQEIAIVGIACRFPDADNKDEYWKNLQNQVVSMRQFPKKRRQDLLVFNPRLQSSAYFDRKGGYLPEIDQFDASFFRISPREAKLMDPFQRLFLETAYEAIEDAGYGGKRLNQTKTGVYVGLDSSHKFQYALMTGTSDLLANTGSLTGIMASRISYFLNLRGPSMVIDSACSSGLVAVHQACQALRNNECQMMIAGGISLMISPPAGNDGPGIESKSGEVRAFDKDAQGTVWGEGVGVVVLKPLAQAIADHDYIYALIKGDAINNDGASNGITAPNPEAQSEVIIRAWEKAGIDPETVSYIETHGTGTVLGDPIEIKGLTDAFREYTNRKQFCGIGSVKTNIGHSVAASGIASLLKVILALKKKEIPASLNFQTPNPRIVFTDSPVYLNDRLRFWDKGDTPRRAGVSSFGFSGTNCHLVLEEAPEISKEPAEVTPQLKIFAISAKSKSALEDLVSRFQLFLTQETDLDWNDLCNTAGMGRGHYTHRLALVARDKTELKEKLNQVNHANINEDIEKGIYYAEHRVVPDFKKEIEPGEISERQKRDLTETAGQKINRLRREEETKGTLLVEICQLYVRGADLNWENLSQPRGHHQTPLPVYPFERTRFWVDPPTRDSLAGIIHTVKWTPQEVKIKAEDRTADLNLVFKDEKGFGDQLAQRLREERRYVVEVEFGKVFKKIHEQKYVIDGSEEDYQRLLAELSTRKLERIIYLRGLIFENQPLTLAGLKEDLEKGVYSLFYLIKALIAADLVRKMELYLIADYAQEVTKTEPQLNPHHAAMFGLGMVAAQEYHHLQCYCLDIDSQTTEEDLLAEFRNGRPEFKVAYRNGSRFVEEFGMVKPEDYSETGLTIREKGVYLITGGTGGIGLEIARFLAERKRIVLCLLSRSPLPEREMWPEIQAKGGNSGIIQKIAALLEIEKTGAQVVCYSVDVAREEELRKVLDDIRHRFGRINGIFHAAGVAGSGFLIRKEKETLGRVLAPKIEGTWLLDRLTMVDQPEFMILFSSVVTLTGGVGQGDYTAANSYLDTFAFYRSHQGRKTFALDWPAWRETGMALNYQAFPERTLFNPISTAQALKVLEKVFNLTNPRIIIGEPNYGMIVQTEENLPIYLAGEIKDILKKERDSLTVDRNKTPIRTDLERVIIKGKARERLNEVERNVAAIWAKVLDLTYLDVNESFHAMGGDSILATQFLIEIESIYPETIGISDLYSYPSVVTLAERINFKMKEKKSQSAVEKGKLADRSTEELEQMVENLKTNDISVEKILTTLDKWRSG